jgi:hypothetical protein
MHKHIPYPTNYEPIASTKSKWLYTRKKSRQYGSLKMPGLFETYNFKTDRILFFVVLAMELYGMYILWQTLPNPLLALIGLPADLFFAIFMHLVIKDKIFYSNQLILAQYGKYEFDINKSLQFTIDKCKSKLKFFNLYLFFFGLIITTIALTKILAIQHFADSETVSRGLRTLIILIYCATAYIHITSTGYFLFELWFRYFVKNEQIQTIHHTQEQFINAQISQGITRHREIPLKNDYNETIINGHSIIKQNNSTIFKSWGILQDDELNNFVQLQPNLDLKQQLAIELLNFQMQNQLQSNANREQK